MPPIDEAVSWDEACKCIAENTVESLAKLGRNARQLAVYQEFMSNMREEYASVTDFIKITVFEYPAHLNAEGKREAVDREHVQKQLIWRPNDFPYFFEEGIEHWLLWSTEPLPEPTINTLIAERFSTADKDTVFFINPTALQSVLSVWHCHVLVRSKAC